MLDDEQHAEAVKVMRRLIDAIGEACTPVYDAEAWLCANSIALVPVTITVRLSVACLPGQDAAGEMWDEIHNALAGVPGVFVESSSVEPMDLADVIDGSPLDTYLRGAK